MDIHAILDPERTKAQQQYSSKKRLLEEVSELVRLALPNMGATEIFEGLIAREKLGTTAVGNGIALPHCRHDKCDAMVGAFIQLQEGVDFGAFDQEPVDLVFALVVPNKETEEKAAFAMIAAGLDSPEIRQVFRDAETDEQLYQAAISRFSPLEESA